MSSLPPGVARHFTGTPIDLALASDRAFAIERLLEDGDRTDLAWLAAAIPRAEIAHWFTRHARRRLSRRSRALWAATLALPNPPARPVAVALWPLA